MSNTRTPDEVKKVRFTINQANPDRPKQPDHAHLIKLPNDILKNVIAKDYLSISDQYSSSRTSCSLYTLFQRPASEHVYQFLLHVVRGENAQAEKMVKRNPRLLYEKINVTDEAGRTIHGTALQIAWGAKDISPYPGELEEMAEMLQRYLLNLPDGKEERRKQYDEQFPEGFEEQEKKRREEDSLEPNKVLKAIKNDKSNDLAAAKEATKNFFAYLKNQMKNTITTGYHFNEALFKQALELHDEHFNEFGLIEDIRNKLAAIQLIGGIQKNFTACLAGAMCDGIDNVAYKMKPLTRGKSINNNTMKFFSSDLGVKHYVSTYHGVGPRGRIALGARTATSAGGWFSLLSEPFSSLMSSKQCSLIKWKTSLSKREESKKQASSCLMQ